MVSRFIDSLGDRFGKEHTVKTPTFSKLCCDWTIRRNFLPLTSGSKQLKRSGLFVDTIEESSSPLQFAQHHIPEIFY